MSIDSMARAWNAMPDRHQGPLRKLQPKIEDIAAKLSDEVVGIMRVTQASAGDFALIATTARLILVSSERNTQVLRYADLHSIIFTEAKKKRFGLDREAYLLIEGADYKYTFVIYSEADWVNATGARIESAFESARLQL